MLHHTSFGTHTATDESCPNVGDQLGVVSVLNVLSGEAVKSQLENIVSLALPLRPMMDWSSELIHVRQVMP